MATIVKPKVSVAEYLEFDRRSDFKNEYFDGRIFMMAGASFNHNMITAGLTGALLTKLRGMGCLIASSDMRIKLEKTASYAYPDVSVICGKPVLEDTTPETLLNPKIIFEILSPSIERHDRVNKLQHYRQIESLTDYLLISQSAYHIEHHSRMTDGSWLLTDVLGRGAVLSLTSPNCKIGLDDIYEQVEIESRS